MEVIANGAASGMPAGGGRDEVERLAEEFLARRRKGEPAAIEEYIARRPDLAADIREVFPTLLMVEDLGGEFSGDAGARPALGPDGKLGGDAAVSNGAVSLGAASNGGIGLQHVGEYRILREVGRGGMGIVYEAEQESLRRRVALKVLPFHSLLDSKHLERFHEESRAAARLSHPNIVPVYGVGEHLGLHYYAMQFIPGQGLDRVIEEVSRLRKEGDSRTETTPAAPRAPDSSSIVTDGGTATGRGGRERYFRNAARIARDAALALDYAHREGILHRDVKPSNLLLDPAGHVWLADFGLAKAQGSEDLTQSGDFVGTVRYSAPERFQGWSDPRSDVYSLGLTLYEMLALRPAFAGRDRGRLMRKVASEDPPPLRRLDRAVPRDLETIVLKAAAKDPRGRYANARTMADDLDRFLEGKPVEARRSTPLGRLGRWCARNPTVAGLAAAVALLLAVVAAVSTTAVVRLAKEQDVGLQKLRDSYLQQARAHRTSGRPGQRFDALEALRLAGEIRAGSDLQDEAIAALSLADARLVKSWEKSKNENPFFDGDMRRMALVLPGGEVVVRATESDRELFRLPGADFKPGYVYARFSADGKHLAIRYHQGAKNEWVVWDLDRRVAAARISRAVQSDASDFTPDGARVLLGKLDGSAAIVDLASGNERGELRAEIPIAALAVHPGGRLVAVVGFRAHDLLVVDMESGATARRFKPPNGKPRLTCTSWDPSGRLLAAGSDDHDRRVYIWDTGRGTLRCALDGHQAEVVQVGFSGGGDLLLSNGWDPKARLWEPWSGRLLFTLGGQSGDLARDGRSFHIISPNRIEAWEMTPTREYYTLVAHEGTTEKHPFSISLATGKHLAVTSGRDGVRVWDLAARREAAYLPIGATHFAFFNREGRYLYAGGSSGLFRLPFQVRPELGGRRARVGPPERLGAFAISGTPSLSDGDRQLAFVDRRTRRIRLADPSDPLGGIELEASAGYEWAALSPDGRWAAAGSVRIGKEVQIWNARDGRPALRLPVQDARVEFDPSSRYLATISLEACTLWRTDGWEPNVRIERQRGQTFMGLIAFDPGGEVAALTHSFSRIWLFETATGRKLAELEAPEAIAPNSIALDLSGGFLAASTGSHRIQVWDLRRIVGGIAALGIGGEIPVSIGDAAATGRWKIEVSRDPEKAMPEENGPEDPRSPDLLRRYWRALLSTELASFSDIDLALECPTFLVAEAAGFRFTHGRAEPSPGIDWTRSDFDDRRWRNGENGLTGIAGSDVAQATLIADQPYGYSSVYARYVFHAAAPEEIEKLVLAVQVDDGFVAYLNGVEVARANAGRPGERLSNDAVATGPSPPRLVVHETLDATPLGPGWNVLAVQGLTFSRDVAVSLLPVLAAKVRPVALRDRNHTSHLLRDAGGAPDQILLAYRDGRILQRGLKLPEALAEFERCSSLDPSRPEPFLRRIDCLRSLGEVERAESLARQAIECGEMAGDDRIWRSWFVASVCDLRRTVREALDRLPPDPQTGPRSHWEDYRWILESLAGPRVLRINCGGASHRGVDGKTWSEDRFAMGGANGRGIGDPPPHPEIEGTEDDPLYQTERWFRGEASFRPGYRIPLPPARYRIRLHFSEVIFRAAKSRYFDVLLEGKTILQEYEPLRAGFAKPDARAFELEVADGFLEIDFLARVENPKISAIEVEHLGD